MLRKNPQRLKGNTAAKRHGALGGRTAVTSLWLVGMYVFSALNNTATAGELIGHVTDLKGAAVANAVIALYQSKKQEGAVEGKSPEAVMDQRDRQFAPHVLVVQRGTAVRFPNSDDIRHQVYSFSPAKRFNLPLYHGVQANPQTFDQAGEVVLGCNIHDSMFGYIYVVDTEWFAKSDAQGNLKIRGVPMGSYRAQLWFPGIAAASTSIEQTVSVPATGTVSITFDNAVAEVLSQPVPTTTRGWGERRGVKP